MPATERKTSCAGDYRYYLQRQIMVKAGNGVTSYTNDIQVWASVEDIQSSEQQGVGVAILTTKTLIRIRNYVPLNMSDRLVDTANGFTYFISGIERSFINNETWAYCDRKQLGLTA